MLQMIHRLPKPVLFGLYGAIGGLLGALLIGELIYWIVQPPQAQIAPLQMAASPSVKTYWGGANKIFVEIARPVYKGDVFVKVRNVPAALDVPGITIPAGETKGEIIVTANPGEEKRPEGQKFEPHLVALDTDRKELAEAKFEVIVEPPPVGLYVAASPEVRLFAGGSNRFTVKLARQSFEGPVRIDAVNLPPGVEIREQVMPADAKEIEMTVRADSTVNLPRAQPIHIRGTALDQPEIKPGTAPIDIMIVQPPPAMTMGVSPQVVLYPGMKNKLTVKIARQGFHDAVTITPFRVADGITIAPVTIPKDKSEVFLEAVSTNPAETGLPRVQRAWLQAKSADGKIEAKSEFDVRLEPVPPTMAIAVSPEISVFQRGKSKFTVELLRRGFDKDVRIEFQKAPDGAVFDPVTIPAGQTKVEVEMTARSRAAVGKTPMTAVARAFGAPVADTKDDFMLNVMQGKGGGARADIVFVLDTTGSMGDPIRGIKDGIQSFAELMEKEDVDARIGLVAFRDLVSDKGPDAMKILKFNGEPFTADYRAFRAEVSKLGPGGGGDEPESSMEGIQEAAKLPFRSDVKRIIILITDASAKGVTGMAFPLTPPVKGGVPPKVAPPVGLAAIAKNPIVVLTKKSLKDAKIDQVHLVVNPQHKLAYELLQESASGKGRYYNLQDTATAKAGFADLLPVLSKDIIVTTTDGRPDLSASKAEPPPPPTSQGALNLPAMAAPAPPGSALPDAPKAKDVAPPETSSNIAPPSAATPTLAAVQGTGSYEARDWWRLLLASALWTAIIAAGISLIIVAGQRLYMSQRLLGVLDGVKALGGGVVAGLVGGAIAQGLQLLAGENTILVFIARIPAWIVLGAILGGGMALFIPNLNWIRAILGGSLGGAIGSLIFMAISALLGDSIGRWVGAALVGFLIGMMVAFAEVAFRRYWLEVAFGKHEIRTVTLGGTPVTIGTDDDAMIRVDAPAPMTLAFHIDSNRVLCQRADSDDGEEIEPGHQTTIGNVTVTMRSVEKARKLGFALHLGKGKPIALSEGMPLTAEELPGLEVQGKDGMVALVGAHARDPKKLVLRNRSKQTWKVKKPDGAVSDIAPGGSVELVANLRLNMGEIRAVLKREAAESDE
jgi:hypothetical protein